MVSVDELHGLRVEEQDLSSDDLTLTADRGEALEILTRGIVNGNTFDDVEESVDETTMLQYWGADGRPGLFPGELHILQHTDVLAHLRKMGFDLPTIKVPPGTQYQLNNLNDNGTARLVYRDFNSERFTRGDNGAPGGRVKTFISKGREQNQIASGATEEIEVNTSANTGGVNDWPYEEDVPTNREYDLVALAMTVREDPDTGGALDLEAFRLTSLENDFIARDSAFITDGFADFPDADPNTRWPMPFMNFATGEPEPITFSPGDDLTIEMRVTETTGGNTAEADLMPMVIARERRV